LVGPFNSSTEGLNAGSFLHHIGTKRTRGQQLWPRTRTFITRSAVGRSTRTRTFEVLKHHHHSPGRITHVSQLQLQLQLPFHSSISIR